MKRRIAAWLHRHGIARVLNSGSSNTRVAVDRTRRYRLHWKLTG